MDRPQLIYLFIHGQTFELCPLWALMSMLLWKYMYISFLFGKDLAIAGSDGNAMCLFLQIYLFSFIDFIGVTLVNEII